MAEKVKLAVLGEGNYHTWSVRTKAALEQRELWEAIDPGYDSDPNPKQEKKDADCMNFLIFRWWTIII